MFQFHNNHYNINIMCNSYNNVTVTAVSTVNAAAMSWVNTVCVSMAMKTVSPVNVAVFSVDTVYYIYCNSECSSASSEFRAAKSQWMQFYC